MSLCEACTHSMGDEISASEGMIIHRVCALRNVLGGIGHLIAHDYFCRKLHDPDAGLDPYLSALLVDVFVKHNGEAAVTALPRDKVIPDELYPHNWEDKPQRDISLVDDLANVLAGTVVGWSGVIGHDLAEAPEVKRVMARFRAMTMP